MQKHKTRCTNVVYILNYFIGLPDIATDLDRGLSITKQILDYAKINNLRPGDSRVDLVPMIEQYLRRYKQDFDRNGIRYSVNGVAEAVIRADKVHLNSIFNNLVLNAMDVFEGYDVERQKEIRVLIEEKNGEKGHYVVINVSDNGPGISGKYMSEIFEPFFSTKQKSGSGLGLFIAKKLIQLYKGQISAESKEGDGTTFTEILPEHHNE
ncbi:MAG: HAMP domain-containing histidine kinase [Desulfobacteraceae bacterium]|nr:MAG: HAMP domain-containing histidine kinase [Desulfobacteraceae bacterium]